MSKLIQDLDFVIFQSYDALLGADLSQMIIDEDGGDPWFDDPSTGPDRPVLPPGMVRVVRRGGSGIPFTRRSPVPLFRLTITAADEEKELGDLFEWDGDEFTDDGLQ